MGLLFFATQLLTAQKLRTVIGKVVVAGNPIENVHIQNLHTQKFTVTDTSGYFSLLVAESQVLQLTHVGLQTVFKTITAQDMDSFAGFVIEMKPQITELSEVEVSKYQKIDAKELGIIQHEVKKKSFAEKRVYSASSSGGGLIIGLINAVTGRTKMLKKIALNETNLAIADYIKLNMSDFLKKELKINEEQIDLLAYFVMEKPAFHQAVRNKQNENLRFMLIDAWLEYNKLIDVEEDL
nr:carboxypeptidase-like regulatory domain-containing protein [Capnocytophaga canimorsus]